MASVLDDALAIRGAVVALGFDIYEPLTDHPNVVYTRAQLAALLSRELVGRAFDAPIRTRAKLAKQAVAAALGYPVPPTLRKVKPRFPGQDLDVYVQRSSNLQVWNDEVSPGRRYAVLGVDDDNRVVAVRVVEGTELATFDKTGTLTTKYQAKRRGGRTGSYLVSRHDTRDFIAELAPDDDLGRDVLANLLPASAPVRGKVLGVAGLNARLRDLVGHALEYSPSERSRGAKLHRAACEVLGLADYADTGSFPDIVCQALEVKLQTAGTIDLGLVKPDSDASAVALSPRLRQRDARYLVAYATRHRDLLRVEHIVVSTGADFFDEFRLFGGLRQNQKLQLRLPIDFFCQSE